MSILTSRKLKSKHITDQSRKSLDTITIQRLNELLQAQMNHYDVIIIILTPKCHISIDHL